MMYFIYHKLHITINFFYILYINEKYLIKTIVHGSEEYINFSFFLTVAFIQMNLFNKIYLTSSITNNWL